MFTVNEIVYLTKFKVKWRKVPLTALFNIISITFLVLTFRYLFHHNEFNYKVYSFKIFIDLLYFLSILIAFLRIFLNEILNALTCYTIKKHISLSMLIISTVILAFGRLAVNINIIDYIILCIVKIPSDAALITSTYFWSKN